MRGLGMRAHLRALYNTAGYACILHLQSAGARLPLPVGYPSMQYTVRTDLLPCWLYSAGRSKDSGLTLTCMQHRLFFYDVA